MAMAIDSNSRFYLTYLLKDSIHCSFSRTLLHITHPLFIPFSHFGFGYDDVYRHWLHIPRDDGKPRILQATKLTLINGIYPILPLIEKIKKV
jgi:hypothetical protein